MAHPQVSDGGDDLQIYRVDENIFNKLGNWAWG
jgi:hypothetical protein